MDIEDKEITGELRKYAESLGNIGFIQIRDKLLAIADRIDEKHKRACADSWDEGYDSDYVGIEEWLAEHPQAIEQHGWTRLHKDADGEYARIGDVMEWPDGKTFEVIGIGKGGTLFYVIEDGVAEWTNALHLRHHKPTTVEDVLGKALNEAAMLDRQEGYWPSAADITNIVNSLADKLQLKDDE